MALNKTLYLDKKVLDHFLGRINYAFPGSVYLALFTADPTRTGSLTNEMSGSNYSRVALTALLSDADASSGITTNGAAITFPTASADWPEITHAGIMDAVTSGNMLWFGPAVTSRIIQNNDAFTIGIGQLTIQET